MKFPTRISWGDEGTGALDRAYLVLVQPEMEGRGFFVLSSSKVFDGYHYDDP